MTLWQDLLLSRRADDRELGPAFATALEVPLASVCLVDSMEDAPPMGKTGVQLVLDRTILPGDFPLMVSVYIRDAQAASRVEHPDKAIAAVQRLCSLLGCDALIDDDSPDALTCVRVRGSGELESVTVDPARLGRDEYVVASARPLKRQPTPVA